jgi:hypothetical protein
MRTSAAGVIAILALALYGTSEVRAQSSPTSGPSVTAAREAPAAGPTLAAASVAVRAPAPVQAPRIGVESALLQERRMGRNVALMIVGGAAVITGLLIGDDAGTLIAVGGAVVGLYGLYQFVR